MSYVPPPAPVDPVREATRRRETWYGVIVGIAACFGLPFLGLLSPDTYGVLALGMLMPLLVLFVGVVLVIPDRTRQWGLGLLIGFAVSLVLGAGACVVLLTTWNGA